jgi:hypothetical protein
VSFATITLLVASQRVLMVVSMYFVMTQSGNFWIHPRIYRRQLGAAVAQTNYGLDDQSSIPGRCNDSFSLQHRVQIGSGAHPAS